MGTVGLMPGREREEGAGIPHKVSRSTASMWRLGLHLRSAQVPEAWQWTIVTVSWVRHRLVLLHGLLGYGNTHLDRNSSRPNSSRNARSGCFGNASRAKKQMHMALGLRQCTVAWQLRGFSRSMKGVWVGFACILQQMKPGDRLAAHTERVTEGLIGCLNACADIPSLAQREVVKELSSIAKATVAKERTIQTIDQVLAHAMDLPACLHKLLVHTMTCKQLILVAAAAF